MFVGNQWCLPQVFYFKWQSSGTDIVSRVSSEIWRATRSLWKLYICLLLLAILTHCILSSISVSHGAIFIHISIEALILGVDTRFLPSASLKGEHCHWWNDHVTRRHFLDFLSRGFFYLWFIFFDASPWNLSPRRDCFLLPTSSS